MSPQIVADTRALPINRDGNTVDLEHEVAQLSQNALEYSVETRLVTAALMKLRMAITGKS